MPLNQRKSNSRFKHPSFTFRLPVETRTRFTDLKNRNDRHMSLAVAIIKAMEYLIEKDFFPGYEKKGRLIATGLESQIPTKSSRVDIIGETIDKHRG